MDILALAAALTVMAAVMATMMALYQTSAGPRAGLDRRLDHLLTNDGGFEATASAFESVRTRRTGSVPLISTLLENKNWTNEVGLKLERADVKLTVSEFVAIRVLFALLIGMVPLFLIGGGIGYLLFVPGAALGYMLPAKYVSFAAGSRLKKLNTQLPEALTLMANSLKAGFGIMQSLDLAARELEHPIATELRRTLQEINVGASTEEAVLGLAARNGSDDLDIVVTAMLIQQATGGNLAEILENVNHTMRERIRIRGEIKTLTSQQMLTGIVIGAMPIGLVMIFQVTNPQYMRPLYHDPIGILMLAGAAVLETFGILLIRKILDIEV